MPTSNEKYYHLAVYKHKGVFKIMPIGETLYLKPKMGIVPEVSAQTYETLAKQFREVVTNSLDAGARNIWISINTRKDDTFVLFSDDGDGMSLIDLKDQYLALGGSERWYDQEKIGRIGIGFLAIAPLCEYVEIFTRKRGSSEAVAARLELGKLVDRRFRLEEIKDMPVGKVIEEIPGADEKGLSPHYTRMFLHKVKPRVWQTFADEAKFCQFQDELRTILPLEFPLKCRLFDNISTELKNMLIEETNLHKINVYLNSDRRLIKRVYGDNPKERFAHIEEIRNERVGKARILGYLIDNQAKVRNWNGMVTRYANVAVEDSGFLGYEGHESAKPRVIGELFLDGLDKNTAISIDRNSFNEADAGYQEVQTYIHEKLWEFFRPHYKRSYFRSAVNKKMRQIKAIPEILSATAKGLSPVPTPYAMDTEVIKKPINLSKKIDLFDFQVDNKYGETIVRVVDKLEDESASRKGFEIAWKGPKGLDAEILVEKFFLSKASSRIVVDDKEYIVQFVRDKDNFRPCDIDFKKRKIILNESSPIISMGQTRDIFYIILLTFHYQKSKDTREMYIKILNSLLAEIIG